MSDLSLDETVSLSRKRGVESGKWEATRAWFYSKHEAAIKLFADATSGNPIPDLSFKLSNIICLKLSHSLVTYQLKKQVYFCSASLNSDPAIDSIKLSVHTQDFRS